MKNLTAEQETFYRQHLQFPNRMTPAELADPYYSNVLSGPYNHALKGTGKCAYGCGNKATAFVVHPITGELKTSTSGYCEHCSRSNALRTITTRNGKHGGRKRVKGNELTEQKAVAAAITIGSQGWNNLQNKRCAAGIADHVFYNVTRRKVVVCEQKLNEFSGRDFGQLDSYVRAIRKSNGNKWQVLGLAIARSVEPLTAEQLKDAGYRFLPLEHSGGAVNLNAVLNL